LRGYFTARLAAPKARSLSLVGKTFRERAAEIPQRALGIVGVVAVALAGRDDVQRVVKVVSPLRVGDERALICVAHEMHVAGAPRPCAYRARELGNEIRLAGVDDRVHGVEPQAVEMKFLQPV